MCVQTLAHVAIVACSSLEMGGGGGVGEWAWGVEEEVMRKAHSPNHRLNSCWEKLRTFLQMCLCH